MNVRPALAAVAPRVVSDSGSAFPAVDLLGELLESRREVKIAICGEKGWGKSATLAHLAASFPDRDDLQFWDSDKSSFPSNSKARIGVFACRGETEALKRDAYCWTLAPWGLDEALEYLMACHRSACERLVPKLHSHALNGLLPHRPILWRMLLDLMAVDESITTIQAGLDKIIQSIASYPVAGGASVDSHAGSIRHDVSRMILAPFAKAILLDDDDARARAVEPLLERFRSLPGEYEFASIALRLISEEAIFVPFALNEFIKELTQQPSPNFLTNNLTNKLNARTIKLVDVDLRGATFHYGSSRSGLVGSPYPSHGTRTGFYTDDFYDQPFKAPEEIRKANLRGVDLRGANLLNVDFYLVDLRDARLDRNQAEHVRQCGAILATRV